MIGFGLLDKDHAEEIASKLLRDFVSQPCCMDPWHFKLVSEHSDMASLLGPEARAMEIAHAMLFLLDNTSVEAQNASIRRGIQKTVQACKNDMEEVCSRWLLGFSHREKKSLYFKDSSSSSSSEEEEEVLNGGGGRCRGYFSKLASTAKNARGRVDFALLHARYAEAVQDPESELMQTCLREGKLATKGCHERMQAGTSYHDQGTSSLGKARCNAKAKQRSSLVSCSWVRCSS